MVIIFMSEDKSASEMDKKGCATERCINATVRFLSFFLVDAIIKMQEINNIILGGTNYGRKINTGREA